ncbi:MAG TPA: NAD(P)H-binding protein [Thermomicrobiales bacterium]|jgi:putative NADH-flavin reductase|nr:NAD(P)H-binding protein [Thermomicrobiales bacterium]
MRLTIFGATGGVGRLAVEQALAAGHHVTAYARSASKLTIQHPNLTVVEGQLSDADAIRLAVAGSDAVVSALGPTLARGATGTPLTEGTYLIVAAMKAEGVRRYVGMATPSIRDPHDGRSLTGLILPVMARVFLPNALRELRGMTDAVQASDLDWTIGRFSRPTDGPATGTVRSGFLGQDKVGMAITRANIAAWLLEQVEGRTYIKAAPVISN